MKRFLLFVAATVAATVLVALPVTGAAADDVPQPQYNHGWCC